MIGIIDSGLGGRGIEKEIKKLMLASPAGGPAVKTVYLADRKNFPYGTKTAAVLNRILEKNVVSMIKKGAKVIVLACNSGTVTSLRYLRRKFSIPIVGVVPAIKPAAEATKTKNIAIFSTPITAKSSIENDLIKRYCYDIEVYKIPFRNLAGLIETGQTAKSTSEVYTVWQKYQNKNIDVIVLGCTHYTLIKDDIQKIVGKNVKLVDSNSAVAKQVKKIYDKIRLSN